MKLQNKIQFTLMGIILVYLALIFFIFTKLDETSQEFKSINTKISKLEGFVNNAKDITTTVIPVNNKIWALVDYLKVTQEKFVEVIEESDEDLLEDFDDIQDEFQSEINGLINVVTDSEKVVILQIQKDYLTYLNEGKEVVNKHISGENISNKDMSIMMENSTSIIKSLNQFKDSYKEKMLGSINDLVSNSKVLKENVSKSSRTSEIQISDLKLFLESCAVVSLIGGLFLAFLLSGTIVKPISKLSSMANEIAKGDFNQKLVIRSDDAIGQLARSFNEMTEAITESHAQLADLNQSLENRVIEKTESIQDLLDNAGQGFLSFDEDFKVQAEFSRECKLIFGSGIETGVDFVEIFLPQDAKAQHEFKEWMVNAFSGVIDFEVICDLALNQVTYKKNVFKVEYKKIVSSGQTKIMVILTNITSNLELQKQIEEEQSFARMILRVLGCRDQFFDYMNEMQGLITTKYDVMSTPDDLDEFFRLTHTLKGNGLMFELISLGDKLHTFESELVNVRKGLITLDQSQFEFQIKQIAAEFERTKLDLKERLGDVIDWNEQSIKLPEELSKEILESLRVQNPIYYEKLLPFIHKEFRDLFVAVPLFIDELGTKLEKLIHPVQVTGGYFFVNQEPYKNLFQSMIHLYRNAVDHGLEGPEEREEQLGKDPFGTISIDILKEGTELQIVVTDDGRGIDPILIKNALLAKGLKSIDELDKMSNQDLVESIFLAGFSSSSETTSTSGRGIGMDAIKSELDKLNGKIKVETEIGSGTVFRITVPDVIEIS